MRHSLLFLGIPLAVLIAIVAVSCSATRAPSQFGAGGASAASGSDQSGTGTSSLSGMGSAGGLIINNPDGGPTQQCVGLQCQAQTDNCAAQGKPLTAITGVVYDPAGALPLYNVYVYIPNTTPDPITPGNPMCTQCEAPASGSPIIGTLTDARGTFRLLQAAGDPWGVPSGDNLTLVVQVGKWRHQMTLPHIAPCTTTALPDSPTPSEKLRLPANSSEGDMPLMAFTSGCDPAECFLRHVGISDSEFVPPDSPTGHVHFYTGQDAEGPSGSASQVAGGNTWQDTYQWWASSANLLKYDIIFNACECNPNDRGATAYAAMEAYLNGGGRLFTTHYYYNWFAPPTGPAIFQSVVDWSPAITQGCGNDSNPPYCSYFIDTSFPKGMAFGEWLQDNNITSNLGQINLTDTRWDMSTVTNLSTRWIYNANGTESATDSMQAVQYMSFNTPVGVAATSQCGRAVFSDVHLSGTSDDSTFPNECNDPLEDPGGAHAINEKALEFLFFDLSSCVQDNSMPPPPPPPAM
jgi:hypothetical protein